MSTDGRTMGLLEGRTAVVTGGAEGIGFATAERFGAEGARVVLRDLHGGSTEAAAQKLGGPDITRAIRCDVRPPADVQCLSAMTEAMPQRIWDVKLAEVPMGRAGERGDIAAVAGFLGCDLSSYMTGTVLEVTGGRHM